MTDEIHGQEIRIAFPQILMQSGYLAWRTCKHHLPSFFKETFGCFIGIAYGRLDIFRTHERLYPIKGIGIVEHDLPVFIESGPENDAAFIDDVFCQYMKNATGRTLLPDFFITVYCRQYFQWGMFFSSVQYVACLLAQAALDAVRRIYVRVQETLIVRGH